MKARIENNTIRIYSRLPSKYVTETMNIAGGFDLLPTEIHEQEGFFDVVTPAFDPKLQLLGEIYFDEENRVFTYPVINKTAEEIEAEETNRINSAAQASENTISPTILKKLLQDKISAIPEEEVLEYRSLFKPYRIGESLQLDEKIYYPLNDKLYKVIQAHTTQLDWLPDQTPALYLEIAPPGVIPDWKQPTGAHDAYQTGDKVKHNGSTWESNVNGNVWEPGVYGWNQV